MKRSTLLYLGGTGLGGVLLFGDRREKARNRTLS